MLPSTPSLKARALRLLAAREHSRHELVRKLSPHQTEDEAADGTLDRVLDELTAKGFISEERVVESVLHRRAGKLGAQRVLHELKGKGLSAEAVLDAQAQLQATEHARAHAVWAQKFGELAADPAARAKQMRFLAARGFSADVVRRVVGTGLAPDLDVD